MSAVYGIFRKNAVPASPVQVQAIEHSIRHRAYDGIERWQDEHVSLGLLKLNVYIGAGSQNIAIDDQYVVVVNGILFNRAELASKLNVKPEDFSDSGLIHSAFIQWGVRCMDHMDGEYVFAVWDRVHRELLLVTDHIGHKPMYYYDDDDFFIFCSEIKGIEPVLRENHFDPRILPYYFTKEGDTSVTHNLRIKYLINARILRVSDKGLTINQYWSLQPKGALHYPDEPGWYKALRECMINAVKKRISTDGNIGIMLSGGLDSGAVACILADELKKRNKTLFAFSSVQSDRSGLYAEVDEEKYINAVCASRDNILLTRVEAANEKPLDSVFKGFELDETFPNTFHYMDRSILEAAKEKDVKVMFSGFGGDLWLSHKIRLPLSFLWSGSGWKALRSAGQMSRVEGKSLISLLFTEIRSVVAMALKRKKGSLSKYFRPALSKIFREQAYAYVHRQDLVNAGFTGRYMAPYDTRSAFFGIEAANPLLDRSLLELLVEVPKDLYIHKGYRRALIRFAMEGILPGAVQERLTKSPYVIDHFDRLALQTTYLESIFDSFGRDKMINKYFVPETIKALFLQLKNGDLEKGKDRSTALLLNIFALSFLCLDDLRNKKKYIFVDI